MKEDVNKHHPTYCRSMNQRPSCCSYQ